MNKSQGLLEDVLDIQLGIQDVVNKKVASYAKQLPVEDGSAVLIHCKRMCCKAKENKWHCCIRTKPRCTHQFAFLG